MINWERVEELKEEVGREDFADVVEAFLAEMDEFTDRLRADPGRGLSAEELHFLKGSALNLGFAALGSLCLESEAALRAGLPVPASRIIGCYEHSRRLFVAATETGNRAAAPA